MKAFSTLKHDGPASVVVFFVAVPLCLGIALASGAPLISGLIAGIVGGLIVGSISRSPLGVSGPAAGLAVIVLGAIQELGAFETFLLAVVLAGAIQVLLAIAGAGVLAYFFPSSVIKGMLAGIGLLIILKQIPHAVGHDSDPQGDFAFVQTDGDTTLSSFQSMIADLSPNAILLSVTCLLVLILWEVVFTKRHRFFRLFPGPVAAVMIGVAYQWLTTRFAPGWALDETKLVSVPVVANTSEFLTLLTHPDWSQIASKGVWITAITLAVVASLETLLCVEATDKLDPQKRVTPTSRELVAQGVGNMVSGAIGGLPVTQVIVRSSANIQSGGRTKLSAILHGALLLLFVLVLPGLLVLIPLAALASILFVVGFKLARPAIFQQMYRLGPAQFLPFAITVLAIVFTDLLTGIGIGMFAALFAILRAHYLNSHFLHIQERDEEGSRHEVNLSLAEEVTFLNRAAILKELNAIPDSSDVTIDMSRNVHVDQDVLEIIAEFEISARNRDIHVKRIEPQPRGNGPLRIPEKKLTEVYSQ